MTAFQEPLEKGWLRTVLKDVREEVNGWTATASQQQSAESTQSGSVDRIQAEIDPAKS
jgi:hypothetical protein